MNSFKINKLFTGRQWQSTIPMHSKNNFLDAKTIPDKLLFEISLDI